MARKPKMKTVVPLQTVAHAEYSLTQDHPIDLPVALADEFIKLEFAREPNDEETLGADADAANELLQAANERIAELEATIAQLEQDRDRSDEYVDKVKDELDAANTRIGELEAAADADADAHKATS